MNEHLQNQPRDNKVSIKLIVLGALVFVSWVATMFIWGVVGERESRQTEASDAISAQWSRPQTIAGPVLTIPVEKTTITTTGERIVNTQTLTLLPEDLSYESDIQTQLLKRGVYETPVYTTLIKGVGNFNLEEIPQAEPNARILWDKAVISINVSDTRGISSMFDLIVNGEKYEMLPASEFSLLDGSGVHTTLKIDPTKPSYQFSFDLPLKGSREISFLPLGKNTDVRVTSTWNAPSFTGEFLPESRTITESGFEATWKIASYGKNLPQSWLGSSPTINSETLLSKAFGVGLYQEVDFYTMVNRSMKYSILFITLTFLTFFLYEILAGLRIHPVQYLLVGFAIALFYLLLLSLSEIIGFLLAYLTSSVATVLLITGYCFSVLKAKKRAFSITLLLTLLYTYLYILLGLDEYSLVFGSILLFGVLTTVMYITRNLDWYSLNNK